MGIKIETTYYNDIVSERMKLMFAGNDDYVRHLRNLWELRDGLYAIMELRPDLEESIKGRFDTINSLIGILTINRDVPRVDRK